MTMATGQIRKEVVACLIAANGGVDAEQLPTFGPVAEEAELAEQAKLVMHIQESEQEDYVSGRIRSLNAQEDFNGLADIHPAWFVDVLSDESPRVIGIILRCLPSRQVRYIIEHLPKRIKHKLPNLIDSFAVPAPIMNIIRRKFERQFTSSGPSDFDEFRFESLCFLKRADLEILLRDLGIHELAMAFKGVDRRSINILFNRLSFREARGLQQRVHSLRSEPASLLYDAKYTVLEMGLSGMDPNSLLMEVGLNAFAKAFTPEDLDIFPALRQKLEPRLAYTLKRYVDEHARSSHPEIVSIRKDVIVKRVGALAKAGSIDESWARFFESPEKTEEIPLPPVEKTEGSKEDAGVVI